MIYLVREPDQRLYLWWGATRTAPRWAYSAILNDQYVRRSPLPTAIVALLLLSSMQPPLRFYLTEETNSNRIPIQYALHSSSFWRNNLLAAPSCRRDIETKSGQNLMFDPGGSKGRLRACPFSGTWRALLCGGVLVLKRLVAIWSVFLQKEVRGISFFGVRYKQCRTYTGRPLFLRSQAGLKRSYL